MNRVLLTLALVFISCSLFAKPNVVCVHGFMVTPRSMRGIEQTLKSGGANVHLFQYPSRKRYLEEHATSLIHLLQDIARRCPGEPINFVTHSVGGVILRIAVNLPGCPYEAKIGRALLIAPPNCGSSFARRFRHFYPAHLLLGEKTGLQLMSFDDEIIQQYGQFPECMDLFVIAGCQGSYFIFNEPNDGFVTLRETTVYTPHHRVILPLSHDRMLKNSQVLRIIRQFILQGWPTKASSIR